MTRAAPKLASTAPLASSASWLPSSIALILGAIAFALSFVVGREAATLNSDGTVTFDWVRIVPFVAIGAIYHIAFPASAWQATPGKKFIGLRVTTLEHERLTLVQAIGRWAALQVCFCIVFPLAAMVAVLGCIAVPLAFLILMGDGRSPWDAMAGTQVVD
ncbi:MAG: RDD family protein [Dehalococcoidia bacterium]|nr:RDD family protein [Dehalococcoidia bacterium]